MPPAVLADSDDDGEGDVILCGGNEDDVPASRRRLSATASKQTPGGGPDGAMEPTTYIYTGETGKTGSNAGNPPISHELSRLTTLQRVSDTEFNPHNRGGLVTATARVGQSHAARCRALRPPRRPSGDIPSFQAR